MRERGSRVLIEAEPYRLEFGAAVHTFTGRGGGISDKGLHRDTKTVTPVLVLRIRVCCWRIPIWLLAYTLSNLGRSQVHLEI